MLMAFCAALPVSMLASLLILSGGPMSQVYLARAGVASVALYGLIYALDFLTRCLADLDGISGK